MTARSPVAFAIALGFFLCLNALAAGQQPDNSQPGWIKLFNGKDLSGWSCYLKDPKAKMEDVWSVKDGVLVCKGKPTGYLKTKKKYKNFMLRVEWRWPKGSKGGNSGVLIRAVGPDRVWPKCVEAQLASGHAGDFWKIGGFEMHSDPARSRGANVRKMRYAEKPIGEWNLYEITADGPKITLKVNGKLVNKAWDCDVVAGWICLQSEGAEIHFRKIELKPL